jgi:hypothetical protein
MVKNFFYNYLGWLAWDKEWEFDGCDAVFMFLVFILSLSYLNFYISISNIKSFQNFY